MAEECEETYPRFRATVADGRVGLVDWQPHMQTMGTVGRHLRECRERGVEVADLTVIDERPDERELLVSFLAAGEARDDAKHTLTAWARSTGYRRVWLDEEVVEVEPDPGNGTCSVVCPACGSDFVEKLSELWPVVQKWGCFPSCCIVCGADLPQWSVERRREGGEDGADVAEPAPDGAHAEVGG